MIDKLQLTTKLLGQLLTDTPNPKEIEKYHKAWWRNTRFENQNSLRLSDAGYVAFTERLNLTKYEIEIPKDTDWTAQLVLRLDNFLESPYYIKSSSIVIFREKTAIELILYGGDVQKYSWAKAKSQKNNTEST
jgi:hypothetical protein